MNNTAETDAYWSDFRKTRADAPADYRLMWFGGPDTALADELAELVIHGPKRATTWLLRDHETGLEPHFPSAGDLFLLIDGGNRPRGVLQTVRVDVCRFADVDAKFAWDEGEDDRTLDSWRRVHIGYFGRQAAAQGFAFDESMPVVLERFRLVWPPDVAD